MQHECKMSWQQVVLSVLTKRKSSPNIVGVRIVGGKIALILMVSSKRYDHSNMVSIPTEKYKYI
jgi:hypothetical protein